MEQNQRQVWKLEKRRSTDEWMETIISTIRPMDIPKVACIVFWDFSEGRDWDRESQGAEWFRAIVQGYRHGTDDMPPKRLINALVAIGYPRERAVERVRLKACYGGDARDYSPTQQ
jgi:hypothetical protein